LSNHYHYIITGAGCAGSSLLLRMMNEPFFKDKQILVIDQSPKNTNDRTWCFWEKMPGIFEQIVHHRWGKLNFFSDSYSDTLTISPYQYKMIRGIDLYSFVKNKSTAHSNIEWRNEKVKSIYNSVNNAIVELEGEYLSCDYLFNSILFEKILRKDEGLLQHFKGWVIETPTASFDPNTAILMDFRLSQQHGTTFMYVMPTSANTALVEYTLFTEELLPDETYEAALHEYITTKLAITDYIIQHEEFGVIPMTRHKFPLQDGRIIYTGIAGGQVKGSSGYTFQFIQKRTKQIVDSLIKRQEVLLRTTWNEKKFRLYDNTLLHVLKSGKMNGDDVFTRIFQKNTIQHVLKFLDNESSLAGDLQIIRSLPNSIFLPAALREMRS
jgi:lycopene beta-cyclase